MIFSDEFAPVRRDPETGEYSVWTSTRFKAAGYEVVQLREDLYVVDLENRKAALPVAPHIYERGDTRGPERRDEGNAPQVAGHRRIGEPHG